MNNPFMTLSRHDLGQQAIVLLEKLRKPSKRDGEEDFLKGQADRLIEAFRHKEKLNTRGGE